MAIAAAEPEIGVGGGSDTPRDAIVEAALRALRNHGYAATSLARVADEPPGELPAGRECAPLGPANVPVPLSAERLEAPNDLRLLRFAGASPKAL
jgi:hypothetical protein